MVTRLFDCDGFVRVSIRTFVFFPVYAANQASQQTLLSDVERVHQLPGPPNIFSGSPCLMLFVLTQVSSTFSNLAFSDSFWKSHSLRRRYLKFVFEVRKYISSCKGKLKAQFVSIRNMQRHPSMQNRKQVCGLASALRDRPPAMAVQSAPFPSCKLHLMNCIGSQLAEH